MFKPPLAFFSVEVDAEEGDDDELDAHRLANFLAVLERYEQSPALL